MRWSILDPKTKQCRPVRPDEWFPIAGKLVSGVWQLDDGRTLMATSDDYVESHARPTLQIEYVDPARTVSVRAIPGGRSGRRT